MKRLFVPDYYVNSIYSIDFIKLRKAGIENLIIDIDNTLVAYGSRDADEVSRRIIRELKLMGFHICILSNSSRKRVKGFICNMEVEFFSLGIKPMRIMFMGALKKLGGKPDNTCVIGDQIFTDILGGNLCGISTILVDPISKEELPTTKYIRRLEKRIKSRLKYSHELMKIGKNF